MFAQAELEGAIAANDLQPAVVFGVAVHRPSPHRTFVGYGLQNPQRAFHRGFGHGQSNPGYQVAHGIGDRDARLRHGHLRRWRPSRAFIVVLQADRQIAMIASGVTQDETLG
ncbi:hypothetical protein [Mycobacterium sp. TY815]|uniref:hypothetical protein n=1 Tax=Mycobacterium sp. TY815 TaxID=3050581 RepID=UPI003531B47C